MRDCIFCKIAGGEIPANIVLETGDIFAFHDVNPHAPVHMLVIPKKHIANLAAATDDQAELLGKLLRASAKVAELTGVADSGYRVVANIGADGGQSVDHLHFHVFGGPLLGVASGVAVAAMQPRS